MAHCCRSSSRNRTWVFATSLMCPSSGPEAVTTRWASPGTIYPGLNAQLLVLEVSLNPKRDIFFFYGCLVTFDFWVSCSKCLSLLLLVKICALIISFHHSFFYVKTWKFTCKILPLKQDFGLSHITLCEAFYLIVVVCHSVKIAQLIVVITAKPSP